MKKLLFLVSLLIVAGLTVLIVDERLEASRLKDFSVVFDRNAPEISVSTEEASFRFRLYDNEIAKVFLKRLPQTLVMTRWGDGAYGAPLPEKIREKTDNKDARRVFFKGEVVFSPQKNVLFLMFGQTPVALTVDMPMLLSSHNVPIGRLEGFTALEQMTGVVEFTFEIKR